MRKLIVFLLFAATAQPQMLSPIFMSTGAAVAQQCPSGYGFYGALPTNTAKIPSTQTDFPMLVSGTYTGLKTTGNGGHVTSSSGYDVVFVLATAPSTLLKWEVETWDGATGTVNYWVKIPSLSSSASTPLNICYGNSGVTTDQSDPANTWDSSYKCVWHYANGTTLNTASSISGCGSFIANVGVVAAVVGEIDGGASPTVSGTLVYGNTSIASAITIEAYVKAASNSTVEILINKDVVNTNWLMLYDGAGNIVLRGGGLGGDVSCAAHTAGTFGHVVGTITGTTGTFYKNGTSCSSGTVSAVGNSSGHINIGGYNDGASLNFTGTWDEVRLSDTARSADYVTTTFNSESDPSTFYTASMDHAT